MAREGGCLCGNVRYSIEGEPKTKALCHCKDCHKISGSTYSVNAIYPEESFKLLKGTPKEFEKAADGGKPITNMFCGDCGSVMWREGETFAGTKIIKVGTMDDPAELEKAKPDVELYGKHRPSWLAAVEGTTLLNGMS